MAITVPFFFRLQVVLTANNTGQMSYTVSANEKVEIYSILQKATGAYDFQGISDSRGINYTNASPGSALDRDFFQNVGSSNRGLMEFKDPIILEGGTILYFNVIDTSAAGNTVELMLVGKRILG